MTAAAGEQAMDSPAARNARNASVWQTFPHPYDKGLDSLGTVAPGFFV